MPKKTVTKKDSSFGADLIEGMNVVLAHHRGKVVLDQVWPKPVDVKAIRKRIKMSQSEFSRACSISKRALQEWEQGGRQPVLLGRHSQRAVLVRRALAGK
jgi:putative transcriptional regulator